MKKLLWTFIHILSIKPIEVIYSGMQINYFFPVASWATDF